MNISITVVLLLEATLLGLATMSVAVSISQDYSSDVEETDLPVNIKANVITALHGYEDSGYRSLDETPPLIVILTEAKTGKTDESKIHFLKDMEGCNSKSEELHELGRRKTKFSGTLNNIDWTKHTVREQKRGKDRNCSDGGKGCSSLRNGGSAESQVDGTQKMVYFNFWWNKFRNTEGRGVKGTTQAPGARCIIIGNCRA